MPRTTLDLDPTVLLELKRRQREDGKSLGRLVSELLAPVLSGPTRAGPAPLRWTTKSLGAKVDLEDKDAVHAALDGR